MASCDLCELEIGEEVIFNGVNITSCCKGEINLIAERATYIRYDGAFHYFRTRTRNCPVCGMPVNTGCMPCLDYRDGLFLKHSVEEEIER